MSVELTTCRQCHAEVTIYCVDTTGLCTSCQYDVKETNSRRVCPHCHGTNMSPYPEDGGGCPHCFLGYVD